MKIKSSGLCAFFTFIIVAVWLPACGSHVIPTETIQPTQPAESPTPLPTSIPVLPRVEMRQSTSDLAPQEPSSKPTEPAAPVVDSQPPAPTPPAEQPVTPATLQHTVQAGDTLLGIAIEYGISMAAIQLSNGMGNSVDLLAGQTITIPGSTQWPGEGSFWTVHVVQKGDTLIDLSAAYGLTVDNILRVNAIADPALIRIGRQLVMPLKQLVTLKTAQATATPAAIAAAPASANILTAPTAEEQAGTATPVEGGPTVDEPSSPAPPPPPAMPAGPSDWPTYILMRINQARAEHGLNTLTAVPELNYAAQAHAEDCARRGWGSHVGSDGAVLQTRLERAGYSGRNRGENWVQAQNAARGFDWWYGEVPPNDAHRRNILSPYYTEIGIGITKIEWGYIFVTDFGRR